MPITKQELNRKLLHLLALLIPIGIFYIPKLTGIPNWIPALILFFLILASIILETLRFRYPAVQKLFFICFGSMLRKQEDKITTGSTYIIGAAFICSVLFCEAPHISFMVLTLFILGDAAAALVGQSIGKIKIGSKSLEGSLACFLLCVILFFVFPALPLLLDIWNGMVPLALIFITSFVITFFELVPIKLTKNLTINDNLIVPVIAGFCLKWLYPFFQ